MYVDCDPETILLDTVCLSESAGRTTARDLHIIHKLEQLLPDASRQDSFNRVQAAKLDISG